MNMFVYNCVNMRWLAKRVFVFVKNMLRYIASYIVVSSNPRDETVDKWKNNILKF